MSVLLYMVASVYKEARLESDDSTWLVEIAHHITSSLVRSSLT